MLWDQSLFFLPQSGNDRLLPQTWGYLNCLLLHSARWAPYMDFRMQNDHDLNLRPWPRTKVKGNKLWCPNAIFSSWPWPVDLQPDLCDLQSKLLFPCFMNDHSIKEYSTMTTCSRSSNVNMYVNVCFDSSSWVDIIPRNSLILELAWQFVTLHPQLYYMGNFRLNVGVGVIVDMHACQLAYSLRDAQVRDNKLTCRHVNNNTNPGI